MGKLNSQQFSGNRSKGLEGGPHEEDKLSQGLVELGEGLEEDECPGLSQGET